jgi:hypothetical protein
MVGHLYRLDTTMGYAAIYSDDVIAHHRAFIARRRAERPGEEYRNLTPEEWQEFLGHFALRKVALGICTRDHGTPASMNTRVSDAHNFGQTPTKCPGSRKSTTTFSTV